MSAQLLHTGASYSLALELADVAAIRKVAAVDSREGNQERAQLLHAGKLQPGFTLELAKPYRFGSCCSGSVL